MSQRSLDLSVKCGAIIVSRDNRVLSQGYNGPLKNSNDENFPTARPDKYYFTLHAEENALLAYNGSFQDIQNATIYITNKPCHKCFRMCVQKGITRFVYPKFSLPVCNDEADLCAIEEMTRRSHKEIKIEELYIIPEIIDFLLKTIEYIEKK